MPDAVTDRFLDDVFLGCAFAAYVRLAIKTGNQPDPEATRQLAYQLYEESLRERATLALCSQD